jgi:hypothetical protein
MADPLDSIDTILLAKVLDAPLNGDFQLPFPFFFTDRSTVAVDGTVDTVGPFDFIEAMLSVNLNLLDLLDSFLVFDLVDSFLVFLLLAMIGENEVSTPSRSSLSVAMAEVSSLHSSCASALISAPIFRIIFMDWFLVHLPDLDMQVVSSAASFPAVVVGMQESSRGDDSSDVVDGFIEGESTIFSMQPPRGETIP